MNRYILHTKSRARGRLKYLVFGLAAVMAAGAVGYTAHSIGTARAKSRETVSIYTEVIRGNYGNASAFSTILTVTSILNLLLFFKITGRRDISM